MNKETALGLGGARVRADDPGSTGGVPAAEDVGPGAL